jgi:hypothetical protein
MPAHMAKGEHKIAVAVQATGFKRTMYFNRFSLEKVGRHTLAHFGLIDESGVLRDHYGCILPEQALKDSRAGLTNYLEKVGGATTEKTPWNPPTGHLRLDVANVITVAQTDVGEIILSSIAVGPAIQKTKESPKPIEADPVALLISEPDLQRLLITELYASA